MQNTSMMIALSVTDKSVLWVAIVLLFRLNHRLDSSATMYCVIQYIEYTPELSERNKRLSRDFLREVLLVGK